LLLTKDQHRSEAISLFNKTWELIDLKERTFDQQLEMIRTAHASRYHWGIAGDFVNWSRSDWQISRVYAVLGEGKNALKYALSMNTAKLSFNQAVLNSLQTIISPNHEWDIS